MYQHKLQIINVDGENFIFSHLFVYFNEDSSFFNTRHTQIEEGHNKQQKLIMTIDSLIKTQTVLDKMI